MNKLYKIILILTGVIFLFSGCSRDPIREVLKNVEGVPRKEKDRSINWYKMNPQISEKVKNACDQNTSKYFQREDCINAKASLNLLLLESSTDLSNNIRLSRDREYFNKISNK
ncbi:MULTISPECIES: hypothetical protein [Acinetobacter]|uniref:Lipoprotein n=3 Tax=Acinetobacter calcoaceticus/baumannii complex TaxID=909768 RepID=A0AA36K9B8_ACINO|nr:MULTISPECIES: hypothetical protein [Acinetobacter]MDQ9822544.1 hypothetical protein [Acinetobacter sp. 163]SSR42606.1 Uncharacterised protein [Acinetobacter baumannii]AZC02008.1 hypothetical protein DKC18_004575 [Acinetobacter nosocomialis]AZC05786.1 hypothetical protein DKE44_004635 [Acinetobacter nosocomialis]AZC07554.1 hypothetical protein DKE48_004445 [Acinetobacter nosocomialis]